MKPRKIAESRNPSKRTAYVNAITVTAPGMFTPVFTPARFSRSNRAQHFQQTIVPLALTRFAADFCPLYPRKRTCAVQLGMSALGRGHHCKVITSSAAPHLWAAS